METNAALKIHALTERRSGSGSRRLDIQGLRAIAVLMVVAFHAGLPVPGGFVGVDVFFVISGFVISAMLMREWAATGRIRLARFYVRRFKRLTPALAVTVSVVLLASILLLSPLGSQKTAANTAIGAMLLIANAVIARTTGDYFDAPAENNPLLNTWSLSVEEQFYLVFPALLLAGWLLGRRTRSPQFPPAIVVGLIGTVSFPPAIAGSLEVPVPMVPELLVGFYGPATRAWEFAVGALLALGGARLVVASGRVALLSMMAGASMLSASLWAITAETAFPGFWTLLPVIGTLLLIAAGSSETFVARALASRPMVYIGDRSYSIYLWHWPFIVFANLLWPDSSLVLVLAAGLSLIPAHISYGWIEQPIRSLPHRGGMALVRLVAAIVIPPLVLAGALRLAVNNAFWNDIVQGYQAAIHPSHAGMVAGCTEGAWQSPDDCVFNGNADGEAIYLVGDSNADHFSEAVIGAAKSLGRPVFLLTEDGCSYLPDSEGDRTTTCARYEDETESLLTRSDAGLVVSANSYMGWRSPPSGAGSEETYSGEAQRVEFYKLASILTEAVLTLKGAGHEVLLVQAVPHWGTNQASLSWAACSALDMVTVGCSRSMLLEDVRDRQGGAAAVVATVAAKTGSKVVDFSFEICPGGVCSSVTSDGFVRYRDGTHITVGQSEALTSAFEEAIADVP